jgi:hypothetical protein
MEMAYIHVVAYTLSLRSLLIHLALLCIRNCVSLFPSTSKPSRKYHSSSSSSANVGHQCSVYMLCENQPNHQQVSGMTIFFTPIPLPVFNPNQLYCPQIWSSRNYWSQGIQSVWKERRQMVVCSCALILKLFQPCIIMYSNYQKKN